MSLEYFNSPWLQHPKPLLDKPPIYLLVCLEPKKNTSLFSFFFFTSAAQCTALFTLTLARACIHTLLIQQHLPPHILTTSNRNRNSAMAPKSSLLKALITCGSTLVIFFPSQHKSIIFRKPYIFLLNYNFFIKLGIVSIGTIFRVQSYNSKMTNHISEKKKPTCREKTSLMFLPTHVFKYNFQQNLILSLSPLKHNFFIFYILPKKNSTSKFTLIRQTAT